MQAKRFGDRLVIRVDRGEEVVGSIATACETHGVAFGEISGIGAVGYVRMGLFVAASKTYEPIDLMGDHEITGLNGNVTTLDGKPYMHLHVTVTDSTHRALGGHLNEAIVSGTCEVFVHIVDGRMDRIWDDGVGLNVFDM